MVARYLLHAALLPCLAVPLRVAVACSPPAGGPRPLPRDWPRPLVDSAAAIALVRAVGRAAVPPDSAGAGAPADTAEAPVAFAVVEWLRPPGRTRPRRLTLDGTLVARDDYNGSPVPYTSVRPDGLRGACFAYAYRAGAQYLLLLRPDPERGGLTPYWEPLAPVNEQVRGARDPWVRWVRAWAGAGGRRPACRLTLRCS